MSVVAIVFFSAALRCRSVRRQHTHQVAAEPDVDKAAAGGESESEAPGEEKKKNKVWDGKSYPKSSAKNAAVPPESRNWEVQGQRVDVSFSFVGD